MDRHPNILWIFSDQQPGYSLACNGDPTDNKTLTLPVQRKIEP